MGLKWIIFWIATGVALCFNAILGYFAYQNGSDIYNWINWPLFRWFVGFSALLLVMLASYMQWPMYTWYGFCGLFSALIIAMYFEANAESGQAMPLTAMAIVPTAVVGLIFLLCTHLIARRM